MELSLSVATVLDKNQGEAAVNACVNVSFTVISLVAVISLVCLCCSLIVCGIFYAFCGCLACW